MIFSLLNKVWLFLEFCASFWYAFVEPFVPTALIAKDISNQIVLITGGGGGVGRHLAIKLARRGCIIVIWDVNQSGATLTQSCVTREGGKCFKYMCDISDRRSVYSTAERVRLEVGSVNILINNAGIVNGKRLMQLTDDQICNLMNVNVCSHFWTLKAFLPDMISRNSGHIVSIASMAGISGTCYNSDYSASKFGAVGLMEALGYELHCDKMTGINVTTVCPWFIDTGMFAGVNPGVVSFLKTELVASRTVNAILRNQKLLLIPRSMYFYLTFKSMTSVRANYMWMDVMGCNLQMDSFSGVKVEQPQNSKESETMCKKGLATGMINVVAGQSTSLP